MHLKLSTVITRFTFILLVWVLWSELGVTSWTQAKNTKYTQVTLPNGSQRQCEIADTPATRRIGLSQHQYRADLCMLFIYPEPQIAYFWMPPGMQFNLDIIFMDAQKRVVHIAKNVKPCKSATVIACPKYFAKVPVKYVIELPAGS